MSGRDRKEGVIRNIATKGVNKWMEWSDVRQTGFIFVYC